MAAFGSNLRRQGREAGSGDNGKNLSERVAALEAHREHAATKAWVLGSFLSGAGLAVGVIAAITQLAK